MRGLDDPDALAGSTIAIARDHHAFQRCIMFFSQARSKAAAICAEPLPAPMTMVRPFGFSRQVRADHQLRISRRDGCIEEGWSGTFRIGDGGHEIPDMMCSWQDYSALPE